MTNAEVSDDELAGLDEFALFPENAGRPASTRCHGAAHRLRTDQRAEVGRRPARVVFLHGGGQNAHTWDTVIVGLGEPALAVDLPGHGRSAWRDDGDYGPKLNAETLSRCCASSRRTPTRRRNVAGRADGDATGRGRTELVRNWCWST